MVLVKPIRVLMVVRLFYPWIGGTERQAHKLAKMLMEKGVTVELVTGWWFRGTPQREVIDGIPIFRNLTLWEFFGIKGLRKFGGYLYILSLMWYLWYRRADYDLVHIHGFSYHTFAVALASRWLNRKTLAKLANSGQASDIKKMHNNKELALTQYMRPTALNCDRFVAINRTVIQELTAVGVPAEKIVALPNGVEIDQLTVKSCYALHNPTRLVFVGRLHQQKGLDVLLSAFQQLLQEHPDDPVCLQLVGDGPLRETLEHLAQQLKIAQHVEFVGQTDRVYEYLQRADIFVLPSRAEGVSNALLEAMACGLPVVVSNVPGNVDVVDHEKNGLLFTVNDPASLTRRLNALLSQVNLREQLGRAARNTVESRYSLNYVAERYIAIYQDLLSADRQ